MLNRRFKVQSTVFPTNTKSQPIQTRKMRFAATTSGTSVVYRNCLLSLFATAATATTSTVGAALIRSIKVDRVALWAHGTGSEDFISVRLIWSSSLAAQVETVATGNAVHPAHITEAPPKDTRAGFWSLRNQNESEELFRIEVPSSSTVIVDVTFSYTLDDGGAATVTFSVAQSQGIFYGRLDNLNSAGSGVGTGIFLPQALSNAAYASRTP